jgi:hypothetical protein
MPAVQVLDPVGNPTGVLVEQFPGKTATMTGSAVTVSGFTQNQVVLITNPLGVDIFAQSDGTAAVTTGASKIILAGIQDFPMVVQHAGGTISIISTATSGVVHLMPIKMS